MRIALASIGSRGDVEPFVLLARSLAERGHVVTLAVDDGYAGMQSVVEASAIGVRTTSLGVLEKAEMVVAVERAVTAATPLERSREGYQRFVGHRREDLKRRMCELAETHDLIVTGDSLALLEEGRLPWSTRTALVWYTLTPVQELHRLRDVAALHLVALPEFVATTEPALRTHLQYTGFWFGPDRGPFPAFVEEFLDGGRPPMFLTMGSMAGFDGAALVRAFCAAAGSLGERAIVQRGWQQLDASGPDVLVVDEVSYTRLFRRCAAAFVHGGTGTVARVLRAGVPLGLVPLVADQVAWASALADVAIGVIDPNAPREPAITAAMTRALESLASERHALAVRFGGDGLARACELLEG